MNLYRFTSHNDETIISAEDQLKATAIYEAETGKTFTSVVSHITDGEPQMTPSRLHGNIIFSFSGDLPASLPDSAVVAGTADESCAIADADAWAAHWPNQVVEFVQAWGEQ